MDKQYSRQSLSFISSVAPLLAGLDSTLAESCRNTSIAPLPMSLVSTSTELLASPLYTRRLSLLSSYSFFICFKIFHFFIFITVHNNYSFRREKRDPDLLRVDVFVHSEK